jgi:hypothetical protein
MQESFIKSFILVLAGACVTSVAAGKGLEYNRDVRPILSQNCFPCHGADSAARKASLRLDRSDDAIAPRKDTGPAITPGHPEKSELVRRIYATDPDDIMPPTKTRKVLKPEQKEVLKQWIAEGAKYEPLWSFIPPTRPPLPKVHNQRWARNPVDYFILARLESEGLTPAPEADRRTLVRRLTLDLTGLPPTPADVEAFVNDKSPAAYENLVDKLMASPQYGEHRARYWLDAARYADTHGIHFDNYREMWSYRDWVISALNRNMPFDQFTIEQLAGDLLPNATLDQQVASGFNRCNITSNEGGAIDEEYLVLYARDRTETTSQVWLGLTAGCAVCHDHKFDPISQREFYSMAAFLNNTTQKAMDGNVKDTPPTVVVPTAPDRVRWTELTHQMNLARDQVDERRKSSRGDFDKWVAKSDTASLLKLVPSSSLLLHAPLSDDQPQSISVTLAGQKRSVALATNVSWQVGAVAAKALTVSALAIPVIADAGDFERDQPFSYAAWVKLGDSKDGALIARMDEGNSYRGWDMWLEKGRPGSHIINKWPDNALKGVSKKALKNGRWTHVCVTYDGSSKISGMKIYIDGESQDLEVQADSLKDSIRTTVPFKIGQRNTSSPVEKTGIQDLRIYDRALSAEEVKSLGNVTRMSWLVSKPKKDRDQAENDELFDRWLDGIDEPFRKARGELAAIDKEEMAIKSRGTEALVMHERDQAAEAYVLFRGDYDKRRDKVQPATPAALPPMPEDLPRNRLGLAKWLLQPNQPLTARVTVNRFWQEIFGTGIVKTTGDFGNSGELPSHPELLDWLAIEFRDSGWDMKKFFKLIVMSSAYRQSCALTPAKLALDPQNRLLSRGARYRMDAEMVRDYALKAGGLLVPRIGGPSVRPYQPEGVWEAVAMIGSDTRNYKRDSGESLYRRSLYTFWKRAAPPASMDIFNAPSRETCTVRRDRTDTPLQALVTLNDPQFVEAARHLAQDALEQKDLNCGQRLDFMAERLLARPFTAQEKHETEAVLNDLLSHYKGDSGDASALVSDGESKPDSALNSSTLAAYTMVANELMNLDEVLNK